jgi:predicted lysophospholipase L1 biosynthesis ABC-type transport system permease subunit
VSTGSTPKSNSYIVVGVVDDIRMPGAHDPVKDARVYQLPIPRIGIMTMLVRVAEPAAIMTPLLRRAVSSADPRVLFRGVTIGDDNVRDSLAPARFAMALLTAFSIVALVLSGIGLYGVISYSVSQRTREIGIRVALGAEARCVAGLVIGGGLRLTLAGVLLGVVAAIPAARSLASLLYGVSPADPTTVACVALLVGAIAVLASYVPARRALRVDPTEALRAD